MTRPRSAPVTLVLLVLAATIVSCGADETMAGSASPPPSSTAPATAEPTTQPTSVGPPLEPVWRRLPRAPIKGRIAAGTVWTGREMIVWGGLARTGGIVPMANGAAYDPTSDSWRTLAPAPAGVLGIVASAAAWTDRTAVFWAGNSPDGPAAGAVYDPRHDEWTRVPDGLLGPREGYASAWTGRELLIVGGTRGDAFASPVAGAVDPRALTWRSLPALDALGAFIPGGAVWADDRLFLAGDRYLCPELGSACTRSRHLLAAYDPASDTLDRIDITAAPFGPGAAKALAPIGWTGAEVALQRRDDPSASLAFFDPANGDWRLAAAPNCKAHHDAYEQQAWLGDRFVLACGNDAVEVYDVARDAWQTIEAGRSPLNTRAGASLCWTGSELIVWSGTANKKGNPTPATGAALLLDR